MLYQLLLGHSSWTLQLHRDNLLGDAVLLVCDSGCGNSDGLFLRALFLLILVSSHVFREVVAPHESLGALWARETFLACVSPDVSLKLVAPGEFLAAECPGTGVRPLAGVPTKMCLQVGRLSVDLAAAGYVTGVLAFAVGTKMIVATVDLAVGALTAGTLSADLRFDLVHRVDHHLISRRGKRSLVILQSWNADVSIRR